MTARRATRNGPSDALSAKSDAFGSHPDLRAILGPFRQSERSFMGQVVAYARLMGWRCYHTYDSRRSDAGFPDLVLVRRPRVIFAELKSDRGKLTDDQRAWLEALDGCSVERYIWRPSDWPKVERILK